MPPSVATYVKENPNEAFVPMVVTGHDTIHSWECVGGKARIKQSQKVDLRGFAADQGAPSINAGCRGSIRAQSSDL